MFYWCLSLQASSYWLGKVPLSFSWMSFWGSFVTLLGLGVHCLLALFPLRYCAARFACRTPTWRLPVSGHVVDLVTADVGAVQEAFVDGAAQEVLWVSVSGPGLKRI